jgi:hypothetical protein
MFIVCLFLSGLSAIPVSLELSFLQRYFPQDSSFGNWLSIVHDAYNRVNDQQPFLLYGYDWLAFAHFILAILFIGPYRDPIKNIWVVQFGLIACLLIFPFAFVAGYARSIPIGWRLIDCSFGLFGFLLLFRIMVLTKKLEASPEEIYSSSLAS